MKKYDLLVLGAGSAGYGAALYAARYKLDVAVIGLEPGGLLNEAHMVENYPGYTSIAGRELMDKFKENLDHLKVPIITEFITEIKKAGNEFEVVTDGNKFKAKTIIVALGTEWRKLNVPGEKEFAGRGVSYCFTCDAPFYKEKDAVAIVGGGDSAAMASLLLADYAKKVYLLYRGEKLRAEPIYHDKIQSKKNIEIVYKVNVTEIIGTKTVEKVKLDTGKELKLNGIFVNIGQMPKSELVKPLGVELDEKGYIKKDEYGQTNIKGVFVAGDIAVTPLRQVIVGAGEGAIAAQSAYHFLNNMPIKGH
jgi:thioredoxin reductase (NADPH)